jgi:hypothetical protein
MTTPEGAVKDKIKAYLKEIGAYQFWPVQTGYGASTVDCLACINGRFFGIEVKRPGVKSATQRQKYIMRQIADAKGVVFMTDSFDRAKKFIDDFGLGMYQPDGYLHLVGRQKAIYDVVSKFAEGIETDRLRDILYRDDPNGGAASKTLHVQVNQLNKKLAKYGEKIICQFWGRGVPGIYRLTHVDRQGA